MSWRLVCCGEESHSRAFSPGSGYGSGWVLARRVSWAAIGTGSSCSSGLCLGSSGGSWGWLGGRGGLWGGGRPSSRPVSCTPLSGRSPVGSRAGGSVVSRVWGAQVQVTISPRGHREPELAKSCSREARGPLSEGAERPSNAWGPDPHSGLWGPPLTFSTAPTAPGHRREGHLPFPGGPLCATPPLQEGLVPSCPQALKLPGTQEMLGVPRARRRREPWEGGAPPSPRTWTPRPKVP